MVENVTACMDTLSEFKPFPFLSNRHLMTIAPAMWPRRYSFLIEPVARVFQTEPGTSVLCHCHFQPNRAAAATLIIVHGLEGSSSSPYVLGLTQKTLKVGWNVIRVNLRNCGGTLHLSNTLYNAGLTADLKAVIEQLRTHHNLSEIYVAGYSLGGNIVLKAAAELSDAKNHCIDAICAISPSLDLHTCVSAIEKGFNRIYELNFLSSLKQKIRDKEKLFPGTYDVGPLRAIKSIREFDDSYTAPDGGYGNADNYYTMASSLHVADRISIPTLIIAAQDDPIVPFVSFRSPKLQTRHITLLAPRHGGHGGFLQSLEESFGLANCRDRFWAENRILTFFDAQRTDERKDNLQCQNL